MAILVSQARMETMVGMEGQQLKEACNGRCILKGRYYIKHDIAYMMASLSQTR